MIKKTTKAVKKKDSAKTVSKKETEEVVDAEVKAGWLASRPNPFGETTTIQFQMPSAGGYAHARIEVPMIHRSHFDIESDRGHA